MNSDAPIGIFDSGLGGLTVLKELRATLPDESFVYLGDTARTPYGSKCAETVTRYSRECSAFLHSREVKLLIVACNTASSASIEILRDEARCSVIGTIDQAVGLAVENTKNGKIGVIGTDTTITSGSYQRAIAARNERLEVFTKACPLFVPLVEQGMIEGEIVEKIVEYYLSSLKFEQIDTLVLGCTHYPLLKNAISHYFSNSITIVECSKAIALEAKQLLNKKNLVASNKASRQEWIYVTDGVERFNTLAALFLQNGAVNATKLETLELEPLS